MTRFGKFKGARAGLLKVLSGTLLAQIITFSFLPVISRVYSPEDFGALTFITSCSLLVISFSTLRLDTAMMLPEKDEDVRALVRLSLYSVLSVAGITGLIIFFIIRKRPDLASIPYVPLWVTVVIVLSSVFTILNRLALRKRGYGEVGKRAVMQAAGTGVFQTLFSSFPGGGLGLVSGNVIGRCFGLIPLVRFTKEFFRPSEVGLPAKMLRKYWRFPVVFAPSSALNAFGAQAPMLFVTSWFGIAYAGLLGVADRVVGIPMTLIGNAVGQVFDAEMANGIRGNRKNFTQLYLKVSGGLSLLALGVGGFFFFLGEWFVPLALGEEWSVAGTCVKVMALTVALRLIASPTARVIALFQRSRGMLTIDIIRSALTISSMALVVAFDADFIDSVIYMNVALGIVYAITWLYGLSVVRSESIQR